jgi:hypothetical protein
MDPSLKKQSHLYKDNAECLFYNNNNLLLLLWLYRILLGLGRFVSFLIQ